MRTMFSLPLELELKQKITFLLKILTGFLNFDPLKLL